MADNKKSTIPEDRLTLYKDLAKAIPDVEVKGATMPYTSHNGHMFSFLDKDGKLALRLPPAELEVFIKQYKTALCEAHGTVLKEYVSVPEASLKDTAEVKKYFRKSYEYVSSLKPKATKK